MKYRPSLTRNLPSALAAAALVVLVACGGGGGDPSAAAPAALSTDLTMSGTITGFGSVIVDGVKYDDSKTSVARDTDPGAPAAAALSELKLGMRVEGKVRNGTLTDLVVHASLVGPVAALNPSALTFTVYGQAVKVSTTGAMPTAFEGVQDFAGLGADDVVEVHGTLDAEKAVNATRIERKPRTDLAKGVRLGGSIAALDSAAKTFKFNDVTVDYANASVLPEGTLPANGMLAVAYAELAPTPSGLKAKVIKLVNPTSEGAAFGLGGRIMAFVSLADFTLSGVRVDASAAVLEGGVAADLGAGVNVAVEGRVTAGVLKAAKLRVLKTAADVKASLSGEITDWLSSGAFKVRGTAVDARAATFLGGTSADLGSGAWVVVTGTVKGDVLLAHSIEFKTPPLALAVKLRGEIRDFDATAHTFHFLGATLKLLNTVELVGGNTGMLVNGRRVEVSGIANAQGVVQVSRLEFLPELATPPVAVAGGRIYDLAQGGFKLPGLNVSVGPNVVLDGGGSDKLGNGVMVLVKGQFNVVTKTLVASWISFVSDDLAAPRVVGNIGEFTSRMDLRVAGQKIDASHAVFVDGTAAELQLGALVEVVGSITGSGETRVLVASKVRFLK